MAMSCICRLIIFGITCSEILGMVGALEIEAICGRENLFDWILILSGIKVLMLIYINFMSLTKKDLGLLIIFAGIVLSVFEEEEVAPVDTQCSAMNGDYKKEVVVFLYFVYGIYAELWYVIYFVAFALYAV